MLCKCHFLSCKAKGCVWVFLVKAQPVACSVVRLFTQLLEASINHMYCAWYRGNLLYAKLMMGWPSRSSARSRGEVHSLRGKLCVCPPGKFMPFTSRTSIHAQCEVVSEMNLLVSVHSLMGNSSCHKISTDNLS